MAFETYSSVRKEVVEVEEVNRVYKIPEFNDPNGREKDDFEEATMMDRLDNKVKTIIYTDGKVVKIEKEDPISINEYYIDGKKYDGLVTELVKKRVYIENASYIIKVVVAEEELNISRNNKQGRGSFFVIKNREIFVKDKEAFKKAKETLKVISKGECSSIWDVFLGRKQKEKSSLEYESIEKDIYQLKKKIR